MKNFRQQFETIYGEGSFNNEFLIDAMLAENVHDKCIPDIDLINGQAIKLFQIATTGNLNDFMKTYRGYHNVI